MRKRNAWLPWVLAAAGWIVSGPAIAAPLAFTGELALVISALDPVAIPGSGFASVEARAGDLDHIASIRLEASQFGATGLLVPVTDPAAQPIRGVIATAHNAAGDFSERGGALGGLMPILGVTKVCLFGDCDSPLANLTVPISVLGAGGTATATAAVNVTIAGAPWTTGTVAVGTVTAMGFANGPAGAASSTLQPSGSIRLVTPVFISTNLAGFGVVPAFGFLNLHFVPEPATLILVGGGLAGLLAAGKRSGNARR